MCLTIPKKVVSINSDKIIVENPSGKKQEVGSIIEIKTGDSVITQNNVIIQKISKKQAEELKKIFDNKHEK